MPAKIVYESDCVRSMCGKSYKIHFAVIIFCVCAKMHNIFAHFAVKCEIALSRAFISNRFTQFQFELDGRSNLLLLNIGVNWEFKVNPLAPSVLFYYYLFPIFLIYSRFGVARKHVGRRGIPE